MELVEKRGRPQFFFLLSFPTTATRNKSFGSALLEVKNVLEVRSGRQPASQPARQTVSQPASQPTSAPQTKLRRAIVAACLLKGNFFFLLLFPLLLLLLSLRVSFFKKWGKSNATLKVGEREKESCSVVELWRGAKKTRIHSSSQ